MTDFDRPTQRYFDLLEALGQAAAYIRIGRRDAAPAYSVLRNVLRSTEPTRFAAALVRMVGGMLVAGAAPDRLNAMHLFLPAERH